MKEGRKILAALLFGAFVSMGVSGAQNMWSGSQAAYAAGNKSGVTASAAYDVQDGGSLSTADNSTYPGGCNGNCACCAVGCIKSASLD